LLKVVWHLRHMRGGRLRVLTPNSINRTLFS